MGLAEGTGVTSVEMVCLVEKANGWKADVVAAKETKDSLWGWPGQRGFCALFLIQQ